MQSYTLNRPDGALLCRVLEQHTNDAAGAILRLAWMAGLMRDEIQHLTWAQVDLLGEQLLLPDRAVPLAPELAAWLEALRRERNGSSERVVLSDRDQQPLAAQSISRLARAPPPGRPCGSPGSWGSRWRRSRRCGGTRWTCRRSGLSCRTGKSA